MSPLQAARLACKQSNWTLTRLQLHKILYLAHMIYAGRTGDLLIEDEAFEAQDVGPVLPQLDRKVACFGARPIGDVFRGVLEGDPSAGAAIREAVEELGTLSPDHLVTLVHDPRGAWRRCYQAGFPRPMTRSAIIDEYHARFGLQYGH